MSYSLEEEEEEEEEEERLVQMVHDFIESDQSSSSKCPSLHHHHHQSTSLALQEILRSGSTEADEREVVESVMKHMMMIRRSNKREAEKSSSDLKKCLVLRLQMDGFNASLCQTSWVGSFGCLAGDYEYIDIMIKKKSNDDEEEANRVIVDIDFRSQFELARPTESYKELTETLPSIFIGSEEKLNKIISLLCSSAKQSLKERGLHIPPWRTSTYMHSKWLSASQQKLSPNDDNTNNNNINATNEKLGRISKWAPPNPLVKD
ncbi:hypothetical protein Ddye_009189 [Dipteronia dyeriana]|uniref:Uncharacterized protein n=1 Tax=Dipteronia dyeriana TaxID=168575 RepID=A0AAD9XBA5_9ROSI|nr:hypothetical protein Ddye_009189 [Dipteronia dyeriana]